MFDPTAFENMKVVTEGAIYDLDLSGDILVVDRNDWVNLAKLSRVFEISFIRGKAKKDKQTVGSFKLEAGLDNLASELLPNISVRKNAGCFISISFLLRHKSNEKIFFDIQSSLERIWGTNRKIEQIQSFNPLTNQNDELTKNIVQIEFNRLIGEEQIDDLLEMIEYMIKSLDTLDRLCY